MQADDRLEIEKLGGLAGFGLPGSPLRSRAELHGKELSAVERNTVAALFDGTTATKPAAAAPTTTATAPGSADAFRYRVTLHDASGSRQLEVAEAQLLPSLRDKVQDELA